MQHYQTYVVQTVNSRPSAELNRCQWWCGLTAHTLNQCWVCRKVKINQMWACHNKSLQFVIWNPAWCSDMDFSLHKTKPDVHCHKNREWRHNPNPIKMRLRILWMICWIKWYPVLRTTSMRSSHPSWLSPVDFTKRNVKSSPDSVGPWVWNQEQTLSKY